MGFKNKQYSITAGVAVSTIILYSTTIAFRESLNYIDLIPLIMIFFVKSLPLRQMLRKILFLNIFIIFLCTTIIIFYNDMHRALLIFSRSNMIILMSTMLFGGQTAIYCYFGFKSLKFPHKFTVLMFFTIKYIEALSKEYVVIKNSLKLRGFKLKTDIFTYKTLAYMFGMLFLRSMQRAKSTNDAMVLRGFSGELFSINESRMNRMDYILLITLLIQLLWVLWIL